MTSSMTGVKVWRRGGSALPWVNSGEFAFRPPSHLHAKTLYLTRCKAELGGELRIKLHASKRAFISAFFSGSKIDD